MLTVSSYQVLNQHSPRLDTRRRSVRTARRVVLGIAICLPDGAARIGPSGVDCLTARFT
ncbi:hypothetical protein KCP70_18660 [Salmonella enterica subsp. enterica]|nr:hypothetical protein KCP70_18660 [Salmonella enterica subsp. enterica]